MSQITFDDKNNALPSSNPRKLWRDVDANEVKTVVNANEVIMNKIIRAATASGTNIYVAAVSPVVSSYVNGEVFKIKFSNAPTGLSTLNLGPSAKGLYKNPTTQVGNGDFPANSTFLVTYDSGLDVLLLLGAPAAAPAGSTAFADITGAAADNASIVSYVAAQIAAGVAGLLDFRTTFDASGGAYPSSGGSGSAGAILKADAWIISVAGTLPTGQAVQVGDFIFALVDTPGNTQANWGRIENNLTYVPVNKAGDTMTGALDMGANKVTSSAVPSTGNDLVNKTYADGLAGVGATKLDTFETRRTVTANHTLDSTDLANINSGDQYILEVNSATPANVEIPLNATVAFTIGSSFCIQPIGAGQVTITVIGGVTYRARNNANKSYAQYSRMYLSKAATNTWDGSGDITV